MLDVHFCFIFKSIRIILWQVQLVTAVGRGREVPRSCYSIIHLIYLLMNTADLTGLFCFVVGSTTKYKPLAAQLEAYEKGLPLTVLFLTAWAWTEKMERSQLAKTTEIAVHDSNTRSKKNRHTTSPPFPPSPPHWLRLLLAHISTWLFHAYLPLVRVDSFNYVAMWSNTVQCVAVGALSGW